MNTEIITLIPISSIRVANPRSRSKNKWQSIVQSIKTVGLKRPVKVSPRPRADSEGRTYDLVCGEGRMKALLALGEEMIPAIVENVAEDDLLLMSLVENIARHPPSNTAMLREVQILKGRGYPVEQIAAKLGVDQTYIYGIVHLIEKGEGDLVKAVDAGRIPISVAIEIAAGNDQQISRALSEAYEKGELRGNQIRAARRIVARRLARAKREGRSSTTRTLTGQSLVREYKQKIREHKLLIAKAERAREHLLLLTSAMRTLWADENFTTLLRAEGLDQVPAELAFRLE